MRKLFRFIRRYFLSISSDEDAKTPHQRIVSLLISYFGSEKYINRQFSLFQNFFQNWHKIFKESIFYMLESVYSSLLHFIYSVFSISTFFRIFSKSTTLVLIPTWWDLCQCSWQSMLLWICLPSTRWTEIWTFSLFQWQFPFVSIIIWKQSIMEKYPFWSSSSWCLSSCMQCWLSYLLFGTNGREKEEGERWRLFQLSKKKQNDFFFAFWSLKN